MFELQRLLTLYDRFVQMRAAKELAKEQTLKEAQERRPRFHIRQMETGETQREVHGRSRLGWQRLSNPNHRGEEANKG